MKGMVLNRYREEGVIAKMSKIVIFLLIIIFLSCCSKTDTKGDDPLFDYRKVKHLYTISVVINDNDVNWGNHKIDKVNFMDTLNKVVELEPPPVLVICRANGVTRDNNLYNIAINSGMCSRRKRCYIVRDCRANIM